MNVRQCVFVLGLFSLEALLFGVFAAGHLELMDYMQLHLGLCVATGLLGSCWAFMFSPPGVATDRAVMIGQLVAWTALAGPLGTFIAAGLLVLPQTQTQTAAQEPAETLESPLTRPEQLHSRLLDRRLRLGNVHTVRPLLDVIIDGTATEKFDALSLISKRYSPDLAPALRLALEDADGSVRVLAATVMAQQNNNYTRRIGHLLDSARATPDSADRWQELGQAHLDYAGSGLLEASRAETEQSRAELHLARARQLRAKAPDAATFSAAEIGEASAGQAVRHGI